MISRRKFMQISAIGTLGMLTDGPNMFLRSAAPTALASEGIYGPDLEISLNAIPDEVKILSGAPTKVWRFQGKILKGNPKSLQKSTASFLGPTIRVKRGQKVRIHFKNDIPDKSIVHWHGLHVPEDMDGHPRLVIPRGETYTYEFEVCNRAGTYWYHPHPHGRTGYQVYGGLAGLFLVSDDEEESLNLPTDDYDLPLVIQDRTFDSKNQLVYSANNMMDRMTGFLGERIMVNGVPEQSLSVATRVYRLRILNGSNTRIYRLAWRDKNPLVIIGNDGGLLRKPVKREYVMLGPAERVEVWADFSAYPVGYETALVSEPFDAGMMSGGGRNRGMMGGGHILPNGSPATVLRVSVDHKKKETLVLPDRLTTFEDYKIKDAVNFGYPKVFHLSMNHMSWTINGRTFRMEEVADDEIVGLNTSEIWEFTNEARGMGMMGMMNMPHPIHLHGKQFQIIGRSGVRHHGYVDEGWKDTVLLMPGERVRLLVRFDEFPGLFLYHCHNLEHEDMGMMRNFYIRRA